MKKARNIYACRVCRMRYVSREEAERCENRVLEKKEFALNDLVSSVARRFCAYDLNFTYNVRGRIIRIIGPMPSNAEHEIRRLGGKIERVDGHVFYYEVKFSCSRCGETRVERYFAPELKKIK